MNKIMNELYYMIDEWAGQQYEMDEETKRLEERKQAVQEEMASRLGENGQEIVEALADLSLKLDEIHDRALFGAAVKLGTELGAPGAGGGRLMVSVPASGAAAEIGENPCAKPLAPETIDNLKAAGPAGRNPQLNRFMAFWGPSRRKHSTASAARVTASSITFLSSPWNLPSTQSAMS